MGTITAFIMPAREAMMGDVIGASGVPAIQRAVTTTVGTTMIGQIVGMIIAGLAAIAGAAPIIFLQVISQLVGAFASTQLAPSTRHAEHANSDGHFVRVVGGLREVTKSHALLPITILTLAIGVLFIGAFLVILPVILRNEFGGEVQQFAGTQVAFWGGSIISSMTISRLGTVVHRGRLVVIAMTLGISVLTAMCFKGSLISLYALVFFWGIGAGITISMSRTIVQEHAPPAHRARVLSVYQLGFTGGMSIGAFLIGFIVEMIGARQATLVPAGIMALVLITLVATTNLWSIRAVGHEASAPV
jgi:predicted MFS family arabinose efflux permease